MDPRNRADDALARARARGAFVVTPDNATSPMDAASTVRIPRESIDAAQHGDGDPDSTMVIPQSSTQDATPDWPVDDQGNAPSRGASAQVHGGWQHPQSQYMQSQYMQVPPGHENPGHENPGHETSGHETSGHGMPPNPYQDQRGPDEFGPLGSQAARQYPPR